MVERLNGHAQREVVGITVYSRDDLETLLAGFSVASSGRRQRALNGPSPEMILRQRLKDKPALANPTTHPIDPTAIERALKVAAIANDVSANEVSQPDK